MTDRLGLYLLGPNDTPENGIYTGDARELAKMIPDESVDLLLIDPPFGIGFEYSTWYKDDPAMYREMIGWVISEATRIVRPGAFSFVFVAQIRLHEIMSLFPLGSRVFAACKNFVQIRPTPVQYAYDPVIFWQKAGPYRRKHQGRDWHVANTARTSNRGSNEAGWHPCPRPLDTIIYMIDNFCVSSGAVVDFFIGSGTTAVAACLTGRLYWGAEIVPCVADSARERVRNTQMPLFVLAPEQERMQLE